MGKPSDVDFSTPLGYGRLHKTTGDLIPERRRDMPTLLELIEAGVVLAARIHLVLVG